MEDACVLLLTPVTTQAKGPTSQITLLLIENIIGLMRV